MGCDFGFGPSPGLDFVFFFGSGLDSGFGLVGFDFVLGINLVSLSGAGLSGVGPVWL